LKGHFARVKKALKCPDAILTFVDKATKACLPISR
jgi:hypothetical protein